MLEISAQPVAKVKLTGQVSATGSFMIEHEYTINFEDDIFLEIDCSDWTGSSNINSIRDGERYTTTYSDKYTLSVVGEAELEVKAHIGITFGFTLYDVVGVNLTPGIEGKFEATGLRLQYTREWSSTNPTSAVTADTASEEGSSLSLTGSSLSLSSKAKVCLGTKIRGAITWFGEEIDGDSSSRSCPSTATTTTTTTEAPGRQMPVFLHEKIQQFCHNTVQCSATFVGLATLACNRITRRLRFRPISVPSWLDIADNGWDATWDIPISETCWDLGSLDWLAGNDESGNDNGLNALRAVNRELKKALEAALN